MVFLSNAHFVTARLTLCSLCSQIEFSTSFNVKFSIGNCLSVTSTGINCRGKFKTTFYIL